MTTVFTNGCFDLIHAGHVDFLERARALGDCLVVGLNSDNSVRAIKGPSRPLVGHEDRARVLRGLRAVDEVVIFDEPTPAALIEALCPDVLVKGGDWATDEIVGADFVLRRGGRVLSLPLLPGRSTSGLVREIASGQSTRRPADTAPGDDDVVAAAVGEHQGVVAELLRVCRGAIVDTATTIAQALASGRRIFLCGNGGSAADAQHIAAEFVGRFESERRAYPALALTTNPSAVTAISNDYGFEQLFARQLDAFAESGDVLVAISTSGSSRNVLVAVMQARKLGCATIALTGAAGSRLASLCDRAVLVPSHRTSRIQEAHVLIGHLWREIADRMLSSDSPGAAEREHKRV